MTPLYTSKTEVFHDSAEYGWASISPAPAGGEYRGVVHQAGDFLEMSRNRFKINPDDASTRRGKFLAINIRVSHGGGQKVGSHYFRKYVSFNRLLGASYYAAV